MRTGRQECSVQKMASSAKFLEEALSTDVDESAVSAIVGSLENQLSVPTTVVADLPNGPKHGTNGPDMNVNSADKIGLTQNVTNTISNSFGGLAKPDVLKSITRVTYPVQVNGTIPNLTTVQGMVSQTYTQSANNVHKIATTAPSTITTLGKPLGSVTTLAAKSVGVTNPQQAILSNVQLVNVNSLRAVTPNAQGKNTPPRLMIPQMSNRPGAPGQITLQALQGLQGTQGGHLLLKTENGQYQLLRVGPPSQQVSNAQNATTTTLPAGGFRLQTVPVCTPINQTSVNNTVTVQTTSQTTPANVQAARGDNSKEKCRRFLTNLLELSSREPRAVERNVRTLIQELIDSKVEPEEFCDRLEKLLNASPQPCLIGFLKKSLPLLRASMISKEATIEGIRPPPAPSQSSSTAVLATTPTVVQAQMQNNQIKPVQLQQQMRLQPAVTTSIRPQQQLQRIITPVRLPTSAVGGMKVVQTPTMPTVATTVRIQPPLSNSMATSTNDATTPVGTVTRLAAPLQGIRQTLVKTVPVRTAATSSYLTNNLLRPPIFSPNPPTATAKAIVSNALNKMQFTRSPMLASTILRQQSIMAKDRDRRTMSVASVVGASAATSSGGNFGGDDDVNDVAAMAGVNLAEESQRILGPSEFVGTQIRSCKDETFLHSHPLTNRIYEIVAKHGLEEPSPDIISLVSHAAQERLKNILEQLDVVAEHRVDFNKADKNYEITRDIRGQLRCLEELDKVERKRHDEMERELLLRAAKSRSKSEDPEQVKLKAKAKELQRAEMEELRQREANLTALQAIGPRKKLKTDSSDGTSSFNVAGDTNTKSTANRMQNSNRPRLKRVTVRDFLFVMEKDKHMGRSAFVYKTYLK